MPGTGPILELQDVTTQFAVHSAWGRRVGWLRAVDGVSLAVARGEILGVVGESGCGKTTLGKTIAGIHRAAAGSIRFEGNEIGGLIPAREMGDSPSAPNVMAGEGPPSTTLLLAPGKVVDADLRRHDGEGIGRRSFFMRAGITANEGRTLRRHLQYCYQDPGASLDPHWKVGRALEEPLVIHTPMPRAERRAQVREVLAAVGLPEGHLDLYPHELSGGQQRRIGLARILMLRPSLVVLDEPTSGLDVSVQATVLRLFLELRERFDLTYLFISHDLSVVHLVSQRIAVMYLGRVVECGATAQVFAAPAHPYTQSLLAAVPVLGGRRVTETFLLEGEPPSPSSLPSGCRFRTRCPRAETRCAEDDPPLRTLPDGRQAACHFA